MQKARIVSSSIEAANPLAEQLRKEGFAVEVARPGDTRVSAVDVEIILGSCRQEETPERSAEAHQKNGLMYVAPPSGKSSDGPLLQPSVVDTINGIAAGLQNKRDLMAKALREQRALAKQNRLENSTQTEDAAIDGRLPDADIYTEWREQALQHGAEYEAMARPDVAKGSNNGQAARNAWSRTRELKVAFTIAAVCALAMTVVWAAVVRTPQSPLSGTVTNSVEQKAPFEAATSRPAQTSLTQQQFLPSQPQATSSNQTPSPVTREVKEPEGTSVLRRHPVRQGDEIIAEDQVVYIGSRGRRTVQPRQSAPQNTSLRRYSDME